MAEVELAGGRVAGKDARFCGAGTGHGACYTRGAETGRAAYRVGAARRGRPSRVWKRAGTEARPTSKTGRQRERVMSLRRWMCWACGGVIGVMLLAGPVGASPASGPSSKK